MMRTEHRSLAIVVVLVLAVFGAGCGNDEDEPSSDSAGGGQQEAITIGYAGLSGQFPFVTDVNNGLEAAAENNGHELVVLDNKFDPQVALTNADTLVQRNSDVIVEFQTDASIAGTLCEKFKQAGLDDKVIAIDIPHEPCAIFYGANNAEAGAMAGERLAEAGKEKWGSIDRVVLLELPQSGDLVLARTDSYVDGIKKVFPDLRDDQVIKVDGGGALEPSLKAMQNLMSKLSGEKHVLVGATNDPSAIGAMRAIQAAGRGDDFLVAGQNATIEARTELCNGSETFIGSVAYFPEKYGEDLARIAEQLHAGEDVPKEVYVQHEWIDAENLREFYPNC